MTNKDEDILERRPTDLYVVVTVCLDEVSWQPGDVIVKEGLQDEED